MDFPGENKTKDMSSFIRKLGIFVIVLLPFQSFPKTLQMNGYLQGIDREYIQLISYMDETTGIILFIFLASFIIIKPHVYVITLPPFTKWITGFVLFALVSMVVNHVPIAQGAFGIYDVIKNIVIIYPFAMLRYDEEDLFKILRLLLYAAMVLAVFGIFSEVMALVFGKGLDLFVSSAKRYGFYRVTSLAGFGNWNYLGIFAALIFFMAYIKKDRLIGGKAILSAIGFLAVFSFSRQVWFGFVLMFFLLSGKTARWIAVLMSLFFIAVSTSFYEKAIGLAMEGVSFDPEQYFRLYGFLSSLDVLAANPVTGLGPGMFGGLASVIFESPAYDGWTPYYKELLYLIRGIDQFWPMIWAETGITGMTLYAMIFIGIFRYLKQAGQFFQSIDKPELADIGMVLRLYILVLVVMGFAGGLNAAFVAYTYFALVGMYISVYRLYKTCGCHEV